MIYFYIICAFLWAVYAVVRQKEIHGTNSFNKLFLVFAVNVILFPIALIFAIFRKDY